MTCVGKKQGVYLYMCTEVIAGIVAIPDSNIKGNSILLIIFLLLCFVFVGDVTYKKPLTSTLSESGALKKTPLSKTRSVQLQGRTQLSRTKSLNPSIMVTSASTGSTQVLTSPQDPSEGHTRLGRAASTSTFTVGGKEGIKVTLTSATPDVEKWKSYDDLLTVCRKKIEASEAQEKERQNRQRMGFVPPVESGGSLMSPGGMDNATLQPPQHWSQESSHESLRHTHSDPPSMHYQDNANLGGHLALAKTLSDEGAHPDDKAMQQNVPQVRRMMANVIPQQGHIRQKSPKGRKVSPHSQPDVSGNQHKKLQRQLSLKGDEDPRVQQHKYRDASTPGPMQAPPVQFPHPQLQKRQSAPAAGNKPSYRFHGQEGPHNPHIRIAGQPTFSFGGDPMIPPGWQQEPPSSAGAKMMIPKKEKTPLTRHASFGPQHPLLHATHRQHQQVQGHMPLGRMASAPGKYFTKSQEQETERLTIPRITRQNSTSDPQLHAHLMEEQICMGIPFESYTMPEDQDSLHTDTGHWHQSSGSFDEIHNPIADVFAAQRQGMPPNVNFGVPPPPVPGNSSSSYNEQNRRPSEQMDLNSDRNPQIRTPPNVPCGQQSPVSQQYVQFGSNQIKLPIDPDTAIYDPSVPPPNHPALNHPPNPGPALHIQTPPRNNSPARQDTSPLTMSPVHQALCQQRSADQFRLSPPPPIQLPSTSDQSNFNLSNFCYGQLPMASPHSGSVSFSPRSSEFGSREQLSAMGTGRKMTPPHTAQEPMITDIISPDTRASIYYHLSGLFPEDKVQAVMEAFPNETDPKVLCAHIIKMN